MDFVEVFYLIGSAENVAGAFVTVVYKFAAVAIAAFQIPKKKNVEM